MQKSHIDKRDKRGFTLVELCVVLALLAILTTMMVSFSVLLSGFVEGNKAEYAYLEDHAKLKDALCSWLADQDGPDSMFSVAEDGTLIVRENGTEKTVSFADGVLYLGDDPLENLSNVESVVFVTSDKLIRCVTTRKCESGEPTKCSFVVYIRSGSIEEVTGDA